MEQTECSENSAYKIQTSGNYPEESVQSFLCPFNMQSVRCSRDDAGWPWLNDFTSYIEFQSFFKARQEPSLKIVRILLEEGDMYNRIEENILGNDVAGNWKLWSFF